MIWLDIALVPDPGLRPRKVDLWVLHINNGGYRVVDAWRGANGAWVVVGLWGTRPAFPWSHRVTHFMEITAPGVAP